jgi:hypothetical protein
MQKHLYIKENEAPKLKKCVMNCDKELAEHLNKYDLSKFLNQHSMNLLIGKPRSGKTSLLYSFFKSKNLLKGVYSTIYIFQPKQSASSMSDNIFETLPDEQRYEELTYENLKEVSDRIKEDADEGYTSAILFDDQTAFLKNKDTMKLFKELCFNRRHLHLSMYFLVQTWYSVLKDMRRLWTNIFIFKTSKDELHNIFEEVVEQDKDLVLPISKLVFNEPYKWLFINTDSGRLFDGFNEIIIE